MKRNKLLIPTLSALAVPAIAITSCNNGTSTEQQILDTIFNPLDTTATKIDSFKTKFASLDSSEWKKDLIYSIFGWFNRDFGDGQTKINIRKLYKDNEGAFKINITKCDVYKNNDKFYGTLLGYVSYVFEKEHKMSLGTETLTFKANDFIMLTFDFVNAEMVLNENDCSISWQPKHSYSMLGLVKIKYDGGKEEMMEPMEDVLTSGWDIKNYHNWIK